MLDQPGVIDLIRCRDVVRDQNDGRELVDPLANSVGALQLVKQVGDSQFIVGILDLVKRGIFGFLALASIDLRSVLLLVLLGALQHAFPKVFLDLL